MTLCSLLSSLLVGVGDKPIVDFTMDPTKLHPLICTTFTFAYVWSIGGNLTEKSMDAFDTFARDLFSETQDVKVPNYSSIVYSFTLCIVYTVCCRSPVVVICMGTMWTLKTGG